MISYSNGGLNTELPFEYQTSQSSLLRCYRYSDVRFLDPHCSTIYSGDPKTGHSNSGHSEGLIMTSWDHSTRWWPFWLDFEWLGL